MLPGFPGLLEKAITELYPIKNLERLSISIRCAKKASAFACDSRDVYVATRTLESEHDQREILKPSEGRIFVAVRDWSETGLRT